MPTTEHVLKHLIIAHWGLEGTARAGQPGYRSQNPWQALEHYMEGNRGDAAVFFPNHAATTTKIDRGGSVWRVELAQIPTPGGLAIDEFCSELLDRLISHNPLPEPGDYISVSFASIHGCGRFDWVP